MKANIDFKTTKFYVNENLFFISFLFITQVIIFLAKSRKKPNDILKILIMFKNSIKKFQNYVFIT